jgi:hypothetical protein
VVIEGPLADLLGSYGRSCARRLRPAFLRAVGGGGVLGVTGALVAARQRLRDLEIL